MRDPSLATGEYYHVYNRAVERRTIFVCDEDYRKFLRSVFEANRCDARIEHPDWLSNPVGIVAYAIMPNHYHFVMRQDVDGGISTLMHRLGTSYGMYFNTKYQHKGRVMAAPFHAKRVTSQEQLQWLIRYIHANPIDLFDGPRIGGQALDYLERYPWSSMRSYCGASPDPVLNAPMPGLFSREDYLNLVEA